MRCAALRNARSLRLNGTNWMKTHTIKRGCKLKDEWIALDV